jgi:hypothetical protein
MLRTAAGCRSAGFAAPLLAQAVRDQAGRTFAAIVAITITRKGLSPAFERLQPDADLAAGVDQA